MNHLVNESSPYLLQHAGNPVDWYPWGDEAFKRAREEDKPIFLSIGYSACHWCHVMAHESFENQAIAEIMNRDFINIKVDKEERPDIDSLYMNAVQVLAGNGGWPLTVFLTPDGRPFYGGTYFAPEDRGGMPGLPAVLNMVATSYRENRERIEVISGQLVDIISGIGKISVPGKATKDILDSVYEYSKTAFDNENGGFGTSPKFPQAIALEFLLRYYHHYGNKDALYMVESTLDKMARGGIYDQAGGGFHRYSVDDKWMVPHFEKMLYDNALLSQIYLDAYKVTHRAEYKRIVEDIIDYVLREMHSPEGGFYSSQDADSGGVEGAYYTWAKKEIGDVLDSDTADYISQYFGITEKGNFEGKNILHITGSPRRGWSKTIENARKKLLKKREQRVHPGRDEKILASWNGYMLASIAGAAIVFNSDGYKRAAISCGEFIAGSMISSGSLHHVFKDGKAKVRGQLQDYSSVIAGFLALHEMTLDIKWLRKAWMLADEMIARFWVVNEKRFYDTDESDDSLIARPRHIYDDFVPSAISQATMVLLKLSAITANERYQDIAISNIESMAEYIKRSPASFAYWACVLDFYLSVIKEIAIVTSEVDGKGKKLSRILHSVYMPDKVIAACSSDNIAEASNIALLKDKSAIEGSSTVYICENYTCKEPVREISDLERLIKQD
jgi:uncharacterized protein YyaL (SSP411 family)